MAECIIILLYCGERPVRKTKQTGTFFCPVCVTNQPFKKKELWTYCHMYWIPLIPENHVVDYVKCSGCKSRLDPKVLENGPKDAQAALNTAMLRAMIRIMMADGAMEDNEVDMICKIYEERTGSKLTRMHVYQLCKIDQALGKGSIRTDLGRFAHVLNDEEKEQVVGAMVAVSLADGKLDIEEAKLVKDVGTVLGVEFSRVKSIIKAELNRREDMKHTRYAKLEKYKPHVDEEDITHGETEEEDEA